jgi:hypothetical protein
MMNRDNDAIGFTEGYVPAICTASSCIEALATGQAGPERQAAKSRCLDKHREATILTAVPE